MAWLLVIHVLLFRELKAIMLQRSNDILHLAALHVWTELEVSVEEEVGSGRTENVSCAPTRPAKGKLSAVPVF